MGLPGADAAQARAWARAAVDRLRRLHDWRPADAVGRLLGEPLDHGGFTGRADLIAGIDRLATLDRDGIVPRQTLDGLRSIAEHAPPVAGTAVPVHADCHWDNWLADDRTVTALLDFEWARLGEPVDDWFFLVRFSGRHAGTVLDVVAGAAAVQPDAVRAGCEVREAAHLVSDLCVAFRQPAEHTRMAAERLHALDELVT
ncbi:hypothetical protein AFB00_26035 [Pseudonocardia sp. HH130630-07]|nr:hypothetical protein AFB00_26035 [Pseudonocardia sp. HH130630-07]